MSAPGTLNEKLLKSLPPATNILELAPHSSALAEAYRAAHPQAKWVSIPYDKLSEQAVKEAAGNADLIVFDTLIERIPEPMRLLAALRAGKPDAHLACCISNASHISFVERLMCGDFMYDDAGPLDRRQLRLFSASSAFKLLLDAGWLPTMVDNYMTGPNNPAFLQGAITAAKNLGAPEDTAKRHLLIDRLIVSCTPAKREEAAPKRTCGLSVIVPVTNPLQLNLNVVRSPGLQEIGARIIPVTEASSAAHAFELARNAAPEEWILYCHQDVYLPAGSGKALLAQLSAIPPEEAPSEIIGFYGLAVNDRQHPGRTSQAGLVVDRVTTLHSPASNNGISLDEFAIVLHKRTPHKIDADLGWHIWATDLCLHSILRTPATKYARILDIPIYHNSLSGWTLGQPYYDSAAKLLVKYPELQNIPTLCGTLTRTA